MATAMSTAGGQDAAVVAEDTLWLLEERLARLSYAITGGDDDNNASQQPAASASAASRLHALEKTLKSLAARSHAVSDLLQLHKQYPELFHPADPSATPTTLPPTSLAYLVLAHDQLYKKTASQLTTLNDNKDIPDSSSLVKLMALQSRIDKIEARQADQARQFGELRARSAAVMETWYEKGILDMGEQWADWEDQLKDCEILVRRKEAAKRREEGML